MPHFLREHSDKNGCIWEKFSKGDKIPTYCEKIEQGSFDDSQPSIIN